MSHIITLIRLLISIVRLLIPVVRVLPKPSLRDLRVIGRMVWTYRRYIRWSSTDKVIGVLSRVEIFCKTHQAFLIGAARMATSVASFIKRVISFVRAIVVRLSKAVKRVSGTVRAIWSVLNTPIW